MMVLQQWTDGTEQERGITITSAATTCEWNFLLLKVKIPETLPYHFIIDNQDTLTLQLK
jgi:translation elongation factor EF-G